MADITTIARMILEDRYLLKNEKGEIIETIDDMFWRVSTNVCDVEMKRMQAREFMACKQEIHDMMANLDFLPNSPTLMNAGTTMGQLAACFVLPVHDSIEGIFDAVKHMAQIHKSGGGTGFSFSELRPKGDLIHSTMGTSSGPLSFMNVFDATTNAITQGGRRRGANMGILDVNHPDIEDFIKAKSEGVILKNFNLSVAITDEFMRAVKDNLDFPLINPRTLKVVRTVPAASLFDMIARSAWKTGDPGIIFIDEINRQNPTPRLGPIRSTNPCGEVPLYSFESCNLGSINLLNIIIDGKIDWHKLRSLVRAGIRFLDDVIDANKYPLADIDVTTKGNRKVGLGVMGFADMLILLGIKYTDTKALEIASQVMKCIQDEAYATSVQLGLDRGSFPNFMHSIYKDRAPAMRNATRTAIAPTGTISLIAGVSSGIEPIFSVYHKREISGRGAVDYIHPLFLRQIADRGLDVKNIKQSIIKAKNIDVNGVPDDLKALYVTALDIDPAWHITMQAAFQKHVDNSVSKTINLPENATVDDVKRCFWKAHELGTKGITVYRYNSLGGNVLSLE
ncbi:MAG: adenosylcobalamin-dependent ribonucleoside-diphosphate reductase [Candidatus Lokiarchaeota archaeon]|nr:adenosylcobalamin-dependent ribonucleoside-diphosphate reductase [Candidatus Lokiarchaeota archaeon]